MRVTWLTNFEAPYRVDFYNELAKYCDLTMLFFETKEQQTSREKKWFTSSERLFRDIKLKQTRLFKYQLCWDIKKYISNRDFDIFVLDSYYAPTAIYAIYLLKRAKIPFVLSVDGGFIKSGKGVLEKVKKGLISSADFYLGSGKKAEEYLKFYGCLLYTSRCV